MNDQVENERSLHLRLLAGDPIAPEQCARQYLPIVRKHVSSRAHVHGIHDEDIINDATVEALFDYIRCPTKFDPNKSGLAGYLKLAAERDLINICQKHKRRANREELHADVEEALLARNKASEIDSIRYGDIEGAVSLIERGRDLSQLTVGLNELDSALLVLMADGERRTAKFATVLGIESLPTDAQRRIVKQHKDRLKVQLKRKRRERLDQH